MYFFSGFLVEIRWKFPIDKMDNKNFTTTVGTKISELFAGWNVLCVWSVYAPNVCCSEYADCNLACEPNWHWKKRRKRTSEWEIETQCKRNVHCCSCTHGQMKVKLKLKLLPYMFTALHTRHLFYVTVFLAQPINCWFNGRFEFFDAHSFDWNQLQCITTATAIFE